MDTHVQALHRNLFAIRPKPTEYGTESTGRTQWLPYVEFPSRIRELDFRHVDTKGLERVVVDRLPSPGRHRDLKHRHRSGKSLQGTPERASASPRVSLAPSRSELGT